MSYLFKSNPRIKSSSQRKVQTNNNYYPYNKTNSIYFRDTIKQFCPNQRFVDHRPNPHRPLVNPPTDYNYFNYPTERENYTPCYINYQKGEVLPLITREDLKKYLNSNGKLYKHQRPCSTCLKINYGNYGRNYYTVKQKRSFPFVNGNFTGTNFRISSANKTTFPKDIRKIRNKNENYNNKYDTYNQYNNEYYGNEKYNNENYENENLNNEKLNNKKLNNENLNYKNLNKEKYNNEIEENNEEKNKNVNDKFINSNYYEFAPNISAYHKTQILNNHKPYLVDEFNDYGLKD